MVDRFADVGDSLVQITKETLPSLWPGSKREYVEYVVRNARKNAPYVVRRPYTMTELLERSQ